MSSLIVLSQRFLVSPLPLTPSTLIGVQISQSDPVSGGVVTVALDYNHPFITFRREQPYIFYSDGTPMIAVNVTYCLAAESITLPPLAAELMLQPVNFPAFLVPVANIFYSIQVAPVLDPNSTAPILATRTAPILARGPPIFDRNSRAPILHRDPPAVDRDSRTVKIKFVAAPLQEDELWRFFWARLQALNCQEHLVNIEISDLNKQASVIFSGPAAVDVMFNSGREELYEISGKFCWAYPLRFWLDTQNNRRAFLTFSRGRAPSEAEVYQYFNGYRPILEVVRFQRVPATVVPLHAHLFFYTSAAVQQLVQETPVFTLGGKRIEAKRYEPPSRD